MIQTMKTINSKLIIVFLGILASSILHAQEMVLGDYVVSDPQVWSFMKYGGTKPDLYTGTVRAEIPLYTYSDPDFEVPISLSYGSNGFMPNVMANYVGLGWSLNVGGMITRQVQGIRDNEEVYIATSSRHLCGYYSYVTSSHDTSVDVLDRTFSGVDVVGDNLGSECCYVADGRYYETKSDIYSFNFMGIIGKFVILEDGSAKVYDCNMPAGEIRVDLSWIEGAGFKSEIFITTGDGYRYGFGGLVGRYDSVDYDMKVPWNSSEGGGESYIYKSDVWHLRSITAPNGRSVHLGYEITESWTTTPRGSRSGYSFGFSDVGAAGSGNLGGLHYEGSSSWSDYYLELRRHVAQLSYIDVGGCCRIEFTYSDRECEIARRFNSDDQQMNTPPRLSSITVKDVSQGGERILRECSLSHIYGTGNPVMMLSSVRIAGLGTYRMTYNGEDGVFPYQGCLKIDHWGFYNSSPATSISQLIPSVSTDVDYNEIIGSSSRNPDWTKSMLGMLTRLEYPTGGWTEYEYEPRTYGRIVVRNAPSIGKPLLVSTQESDGGGVRVKTITDHAADGVESVRRYEYGTGNMLSFPRYSHIIHREASGPGSPTSIVDVDNISTTTGGYMMDDTYIEYGTVTEIFGDSSRVVHRFRSYQDTPDDMGQLPERHTWPGGALIVPVACVIPDPVTAHNFFMEFPSRHEMRGKPLEELHYSPDGFLLMRTNRLYDDVTESIPFVGVTTDCLYEGRYLLPYCDLVSRTTETYDEAGNMTGTTVSYVYNALRQRRSESYADETGAVHRKDYFRVNEIPSASRTPAEAAMWSSGVTSYPLYEVESLTDGSGSWLVSSRHSVFTDTGGIFRVSSEEEAEVGPRQPYSGGLPSSLSYRPLYTFGSFDAHGRPTTFTDANGIHSLMIWGYGGLYPVAMVVNTSPPSLSGAGISLGTILPGGLSASQEASLRGIEGASVTTWKYQPSVGVTEKTGPDGRKATYEYDPCGRLTAVKGPDSETISEYIYSPEL